jgi:hypothetical protein
VDADQLDEDAALRAVLETLDEKARDDLRRVLIVTRPTATSRFDRRTDPR